MLGNFIMTISMIKVICSLELDKETYKYVTYRDFIDLTLEINKSNLNNLIIRWRDGFEQYPGIVPPQCRSSPNGLCKNLIFEIADFEKGESFVRKQPTVLLLAGMHGDEVVGTNSMYYFIKFIMKNYYHSKSVTHLIQNNRLLIVPMSNVNGFDFVQREEEFVDSKGEKFSNDPNRDFPYNLLDHSKCFQTSTAILIDYIFRYNLIVGCLTFHGGENSITYPWGNFAHEEQPKTGDQVAFQKISEILQTIGSEDSSNTVEKYKIGLLQDIVYDVHGGFEDWAYGASFDTSNVSKTCASRKAETFFKETVSYNRDSNRALVYLIEAGYNKIPNNKYLGNEIALVERRSPWAQWGHVTRNIAIAWRFAEMMKPQLKIHKIAVDDDLILTLKIRGCVTLGSLKFNYRNKEDSRSYDHSKNEYTIICRLLDLVMYIPELKIDFECDHELKQTTENLLPESHFVKMRTDPNFSAENNGYKLTSEFVLISKIVNLKVNQIAEALLYNRPDGVIGVSYTNQYVIPYPNNKILLNYDRSNLSLTAKFTKEKDEISIRLYKYGDNGCCSGESNGGRYLYQLEEDQKYEVHEEMFLTLLGRGAEILNSKTMNSLYNTTVILSNFDESNFLILPSNGLSCSNSFVNPYFYVTIVPLSDKEFKINVMTDKKNEMIFSLGEFNESLFNDESFKSANNLFNYFALVSFKDNNQIRFLGRRIRILGSNDVELFSCFLSQRNPYYDELVNIEHDYKKSNHLIPIKQPVTIDYKLYLLVVFLFVLIFMAIYLLKKAERGSNHVNDSFNKGIELPGRNQEA